METAYQVLGFTLMALGTALVISGMLWGLGRFLIPWFYNIALIVVGICLALLGQWLVL